MPASPPRGARSPGRHVVLIHGIPGSGRSWDAVLDHLSGDPAVCPVVPDLLGFAGSGRPTSLEDLHAAAQAARLETALDRCGVLRPILVGHDFGGPVALRLLMRRPNGYAGVVLAATNAFGDTPIPFPLSLVNAPLVGGALARLLFSRAALSGMCRFGARRGSVDAAAAVGDAAQAAAIRTIFAGSLSDLPGLYGPIERALPSLRVPALVVWGERDPFFPRAVGERTAAAIPGAALEVLRGCGHFLPEEAPHTFAQLIAAFAHTVSGAAPARTSDVVRAAAGAR
ncbi:MAG TPA: alpha/beta hydrolase [Chloroflexota bacterium]|nr:alpha/beta hydrolase [Chloroflexota bacterium]